MYAKLLEKAKADIECKDRKYHLKTYKNCFLGKDLVAWIEENVVNGNTEEALAIGRKWQEEYKWFRHVTCDHELKNGNLFFVWQQPRKISRAACLSSSSLELSSSGEDPPEKNWLEFPPDLQPLLDILDPAVLLNNMLYGNCCIETKDRTYRSKVYPNCWCGSEAVSWMEDKLLLTRSEAVQIGSFLMHQGYFRHVCDSRQFYDKNFFYTTDKSFKTCKNAPFTLLFNRELIDIMHNNKSVAHAIFCRTQAIPSDIAHVEVPFNDSKAIGHMPPIIQFCAEELVKPENLLTPGLFRLSAQSAVLERIQMLMGCCIDGGLVVIKAARGDKLPILYSQILKSFLSGLQDGLLSTRYSDVWLQWDTTGGNSIKRKVSAKRQSLTDSESQEIVFEDALCLDCIRPLMFRQVDTGNQDVNRIRGLIFKLPSMIVMSLWKVISLLHKVQNCPETLMDRESLAKLFTPILFRVESGSVEDYLTQSDIIFHFIDFLILNQEKVFRTVVDGTASPEHKRTPSRLRRKIRGGAMPKSPRRNSSSQLLPITRISQIKDL